MLVRKENKVVRKEGRTIEDAKKQILKMFGSKASVVDPVTINLDLFDAPYELDLSDEEISLWRLEQVDSCGNDPNEIANMLHAYVK